MMTLRLSRSRNAMRCDVSKCGCVDKHQSRKVAGIPVCPMRCRVSARSTM